MSDSSERARWGLTGLLQERNLLADLVSFARGYQLKDSDKATRPRRVLLIPGFLLGDASLYPLAAILRAVGHQVSMSGIWCNANDPTVTMERLGQKLLEASGSRQHKVTVVGHSLGGLFARELARRHPDLVQRTILLGSPLKEPLQSISYLIKVLASATHLMHKDHRTFQIEECEACGVYLLPSAQSVPQTIIYTKRDGVVRWESCIESGSNVEAIEVDSTHCGLPYNWEAIRVILERLQAAPNLRIASVHRLPLAPGSGHSQPPQLRLVSGSKSVA